MGISINENENLKKIDDTSKELKLILKNARERKSKTQSIQQLSSEIKAIIHSDSSISKHQVEQMFKELDHKKIQFSKDKTLWITRTPSKQITWLEKGNGRAGFEHIINRHFKEFSSWGLSKLELCDLIYKTVTSQEGTIHSTHAKNYDIVLNGTPKKLRVVTGSNGFIVTAHPCSRFD